LTAEAESLYRLAAEIELRERAGAAAARARGRRAAGRAEEARTFVLEGNDPVLVAGLALEAHDFVRARRLLDEARTRDPFDPRSASARGRLAFLEKRFAAAVDDLLEAALLRPDGLPDATDLRFLRAARVLAPAAFPGWREAASEAGDRLQARAGGWGQDLDLSSRLAPLVRSLVSRGGRSEGVLDRARRLTEIPGLETLGDHALVGAAEGGELRRLAAGSPLYRFGDGAAEVFLVLSGELRLSRETPVGAQAMGTAAPAEFLGEEALAGGRRMSDARATQAASLLGFAPDFFDEHPARASWLRHLRRSLARRLSWLDDRFSDFFPEAARARAPAVGTGIATEISPEEKSRFLAGGGLSDADGFLFGAFAEERSYPAEAVIFREGDAGDALYAIARGRVRISRHLAGGEEALAILGPGEIFGEMALLDPGPRGRSADARAHENCVLLSLARDRFESLEDTDPDGCADLSALLCRIAAQRCVETSERLARWRILAGPG
ncbi:MAG: cyclic nucleotide-binding domain-containing protein, partial [Thermoanaerobaculia bacterium]|nr:cyclic nucleotide-binding domain-containing protein [Thermoanaerobaculia bacterium]